MKNLTGKEKLEVLDRTIKVFQGECNRCGGILVELGPNNGIAVECSRCCKRQMGVTFGEAYVLFAMCK